MAEDEGKPEGESEASSGAAGDGPPPLGDSDKGGDGGTSSAADSMERSLPDVPADDGSGAGVALGQGSLSEKNEKMFAMLAHVLGAVPLIGPLVIWMLKRDESPFVNDQGRESVCFQLVIVIVLVALGLLSNIPFVACVTLPLLTIIYVINVIMVIIAGLKASEGITYRYPFAMRVI